MKKVLAILLVLSALVLSTTAGWGAWVPGGERTNSVVSVE